jgi:hypothetical protein
MPNYVWAQLAVMVALGASQSVVPSSVRTNLSYADAAPIFVAFRGPLLPAELGTKTPTELRAAWPEWLSRHDAEIRARLERGDEDSLVNFLLFGTTFTTRTRAPAPELASPTSASDASDLIQGRIDDLIVAMAAPGTSERLLFARQVVERKGINLTTPEGKDQVRRYLNDAGSRMLAELAAYRHRVEATTGPNIPGSELTELSTLYQNRGLSSDTTLLPDFGVHQALEVMQSRHVLGAPVRRIGIIGPGLDFTDKAYGYDFYPVQTIQPFALIDSVLRLGLAKLDDLQVRAFDLSPRIIGHLEAARANARAGNGYVVALPLNRDVNWNPALLHYWNQFGNSIGAKPKALNAPANAGAVAVRAVEIPPKAVFAVFPEDLNIVVQRLARLPRDEQFDLIVATNILTYYNVFDQSLALLNIESMLRPGGLLISNAPMLPESAFTRSGGAVIINYSVHQSDQVFWYQRQAADR